MTLIKVENNVATREPVPGFLDRSGSPEALASLLDLSWTDPQYGVQNAAWWPEEDQSGELGTNKKWGAEMLTPAPDRKVVIVKRKQVSMTKAEIAERDEAVTAAWMDQIAARRYQAEIGGIELAGLPIATDDRSKLLINGAAARATRDSSYVLKWKTDEGFIDLPADQVLTMADAVADHVQACFDREAELQAAVADGTITAEMIEQGWPS
ncbi:TPA: DUF4376 domain-containing protein [Pseudomonas putida]|uniref:DUF4376 domain-containing protein n=1 Tax=Pseudomonas putida TaxID=303 RepID=UPI002363BE8C|nr:DUF4376 domain-containing protein [Pseudomonas putida]MDD2077477.1 DUF4376 domain-containing protein [Pseudomonas putida]HDS1694761.1 DUF4376 domain-containing protein [Pseudomonas putida]